MKDAVWIIWAAIIACVLTLALPANAQRNNANEENKQCIKRHGEEGVVKKFPKGDFVSTYIDPMAFEKSVHGRLQCTACHKEFADHRHPSRVFRSKSQYRIKESRVCRDCHAEDDIKSRTVHKHYLRRKWMAKRLYVPIATAHTKSFA